MACADSTPPPAPALLATSTACSAHAVAAQAGPADALTGALSSPDVEARREDAAEPAHNIRFAELDRFLQRLGVRARQRGTSHVHSKREDGLRLTVAKPHGGQNKVNEEAIADILAMLKLIEAGDDDPNDD